MSDLSSGTLDKLDRQAIYRFYIELVNNLYDRFGENPPDQLLTIVATLAFVLNIPLQNSNPVANLYESLIGERAKQN